MKFLFAFGVKAEVFDQSTFVNVDLNCTNMNEHDDSWQSLHFYEELGTAPVIVEKKQFTCHEEDCFE